MARWRRAAYANSSQQPSLPGLFAPFAKSRRLSTPHEQALDTAKTRIAAAIFVFSLLWLVVSGRLVDLMLFNDAPEAQSMRIEPGTGGPSNRADVYDRNGTVLATSIPTQSLCVDGKKLIDQKEAEIELLATIPDLDQKKLDEAIHGGKHCALIRRHLSPRQTYEVNKLGLVGLEFQPDERRLYPSGNIMAHVVGYTDIDDKGLGGVEKNFDNQLDEQQEPVNLSLDLRVQTIMHDELANAIQTFHAIGAAGMVMDIQSGEILALSSLPDFDPAHPGTGDDAERFNRATLGVYEMGSTFKIFNTALALDSGLMHPGDTFDTVHPIEVGNQTIKDFEQEKRWLNVGEIFTHSSNIGAAHMAERFGGARQRAFLTRLGLTEKAKLEIPEMGAPLVPTAKEWNDTTTMTAAFGHGIAVDAIQLVSAVATIVNNGIPVHPTLLKAAAHEPTDEEKRDRVVSLKTSAQMRGLMRLVVTRGTAKGAEVPGYMLGGKTGTADKIVNGRYNKNARLSSFVGVFPINAPRYIVFAMLDDPKGNAKTYGFATGGMIAAPVVGKVVSRIGPLLDIAPLDEDLQAAAQRQVLKPLGALMIDGVPVDEGSNYASNEADSVR